MNVTTTPAATSSSTATPRPRAKRLIIGLAGATVLVAGAVTTAVVADNHGPATAPGVSSAVQQAGLVRADRLQSEADARTTGGETVLTQIHGVTGVGTAAQQARTRLYQELRNR